VRLRTVPVLAAVALLVGCGPLGPAMSPTPTAARATQLPTPGASPMPTPPVVVRGLDLVPAEAVGPVLAAVADLAEGQELPPDAEVTVTEVREVEWPDASLGCPQPGMVYAQVITPGYVVVLEVEGQEYEYHTDSAQRAVLCLGQPERPTVEAGSATPPSGGATTEPSRG
jgi:hypothetical protein